MDTQNFIFKRSIDVPNAGVMFIQLGSPDGYLMQNDICLCKVNSFDFIALNGIMLRNALLNSKDFIKSYLGIEIKDALVAQPVQQPVKPIVEESKPKQPKTKAKKTFVEELQKDEELLKEAKESSEISGVKTMEVEDLW